MLAVCITLDAMIFYVSSCPLLMLQQMKLFSFHLLDIFETLQVLCTYVHYYIHRLPVIILIVNVLYMRGSCIYNFECKNKYVFPCSAQTIRANEAFFIPFSRHQIILSAESVGPTYA